MDRKMKIAAIIEQAHLQAGVVPGAKLTSSQQEAVLSIGRKLAFEAGQVEGRAEAVAEGERQQRTRCRAITEHAEACDRKELASYFAFETDMSAEDAIRALTAAPKARQKLSLLDVMVAQLHDAKTDALDTDLNTSIDRLVASRWKQSS